MKALLVSLVVMAAGVARAEDAPKLGVLDFQANGASEQLAAATSGVAANEVGRLGLFKVITSEAIRNLLALERQKQFLGCTKQECMSELSDVLGLEYAVTGKVSRIEGRGGLPTTFTLEMTLLDVKRGRQQGSDIQTSMSEAELMGKVARGTIKLLSKLLEGRSGDLVVSASESGAVVKVDDVVVGTTPLTGRLKMPGGPHFLIVEKQGFVAWQRELKVAPAELTEESVVLVPSADYVSEYEARTSRMRLGAWLSGGLAVAGAGTAALLQVWANRLYGSADQEGTFAYHQAKLRAGLETEGDVNHRSAAEQLRSTIGGYNTGTYVAVGAGGAAAIAAAYFLIAGDDPGRYAKYREAKPQLSVVPAPGGAFASLTLGF